jgi:hypothetical protein
MTAAIRPQKAKALAPEVATQFATELFEEARDSKDPQVKAAMVRAERALGKLADAVGSSQTRREAKLAKLKTLEGQARRLRDELDGKVQPLRLVKRVNDGPYPCRHAGCPKVSKTPGGRGSHERTHAQPA